MNGQAVGFAVAFLAAFVIGLVLGVLGCAGAIKFVEWMRGRALFFTPWPRVQRADIQYVGLVLIYTFMLLLILVPS